MLIVESDQFVQIRDWAAPSISRFSVIMVAGLNEGDTWTRKSPPNTVERSHALLGRTVQSEELWKTRMILDQALKSYSKGPWHVLGKGETAVHVAYAAIFEPAVTEVTLVNPPTSHMEGPHFPGILRVIDIPEALGLLAPRPLTIIGGKDKAFDRTAEIYRLAGAADKLTRK